MFKPELCTAKYAVVLENLAASQPDFADSTGSMRSRTAKSEKGGIPSIAPVWDLYGKSIR